MNWFSWQRPAKTGHLRIIGPITEPDPEFDSLLADIERAGAVFIHRIDSPGGDVLTATQLFHALQGRCRRAMVSRAESSAVLIAMAADEIVIDCTGEMMLHGTSTTTHGGEGAHRAAIGRLATANTEFIDIVSKRSRSSPDTVRGWFSGGDHRFSAQQAIELGLADRIIDAPVEQQSQPVVLIDDEERVMQALRALGTVRVRDRQKFIGRILIWAAGERSDHCADAQCQLAQPDSAAVAAPEDGSAAHFIFETKDSV